jgi:tRNA G18 (ribose-2'-O)-methylase SpoU
VIVPIDRLDDARLDPYRDLKRTNRTRDADWFIAEGRWVVRRLLESDVQVVSVLLAESAADEFRARITADVPVFVLPTKLVSELVGFQFHRGVLACGRRTKRTSLTDCPPTDADSTATWVCCPFTVLPDNLGSIIRICTAFGVDAMIVGKHSADPFSRRAIRVSMGNIFRLPIVEPEFLSATLTELKARHEFAIVAASGSATASSLPMPRPGRRMVLLLGNEAHGLDDELLALCDLQVTIPMSGATDSLNVTSAAAVLLYQFMRVAE